MQIDPYARLQDPHGLPAPSDMSTGETLGQELNFLHSQGLTSVVTLTCSDADNSLLPWIVNCFEGMVADGHFEYPTLPTEASPFELNENEPNREERLLFANLHDIPHCGWLHFIK